MACESGDTEMEIVSLRKLGGAVEATDLAQARRYLEESLAPSLPRTEPPGSPRRLPISSS